MTYQHIGYLPTRAARVGKRIDFARLVAWWTAAIVPWAIIVGIAATL